MKLWSDGWVNGERMAQRFAAGKPAALGELN